MKNGPDNAAGENQGNDAGRDMMNEAHQELDESKNSIRDLIRLRRSLYGNDQEKMDEYMDKAIDAINQLFNDEVDPEK